MILEKTRNTPKIRLSISEPVFEIQGPSFAEHISEIYTPILEWIEQEIPMLEHELTCVFKFDMLNSVSYKFVIQIVMRMVHFVKTGKKINIQWYYYKDDEDNFAVGKDLAELFEIPFELKSYN